MTIIQQPIEHGTPATPAQRAMVAAIFAGLGLLALGLLWLVVFDVAARYRLTCVRSPAVACTVVRERLGGDLQYQVKVSPGMRALVEVTHPRRGTPRVYLELRAGDERSFLVEYEGPDAWEHANAAATRLDAFLVGAGPPIVEETVGSRAVAWGLVGAVVALLAGIGWAYGLVRARLGGGGPSRRDHPAELETA